MTLNTGKLKKLLAAAIGSPLVVTLAAQPGTPGKVAAALVGAATIYVNWGHAASGATLADYLRSVVAPELPQLIARLEALENPMIKDSIKTLETNLPIIKSALANAISDEDAAKFDQLAADSQSIVDSIGATTPTAAAPVADPAGAPVATAPAFDPSASLAGSVAPTTTATL